MPRTFLLLLTLVVASHHSVTIRAQNDAMSRLITARSLKCEFGPGNHGEWKNGVVVPGSGRFGAPGAASMIHYDAIDMTAGKARLIGTAGSGDLTVMADSVGITLIEKVPLGGLAMTTIFGSYDTKRSFPAVLSKHIELFGPFPQQYYGSCVVWQ
jgi:hypothetical protein